jgi:hypothetical protein
MTIKVGDFLTFFKAVELNKIQGLVTIFKVKYMELLGILYLIGFFTLPFGTWA